MATWFKVANDFATHPKIVGLSDGAIAAWFRCIGYCSLHLTDGHIPKPAGRHLGTRRALAELVDNGLLIDRRDAGWSVNGYTEHQQTSDEVEAARTRERDKKRRQRAESSSAVPPGHEGDKVGSPPGCPPDVPPPDTDTDDRSQIVPTAAAVVDTPEGRIAAATEVVIGRKGTERTARGKPNPDAWLDAARRGITTDLRRHPDLGRLIHDQADPETIADLLAPRPAPARPAHDPACPLCDGTRWRETDDGQVYPCGTETPAPHPVNPEPAPDPDHLAAIHTIRRTA